MLGRFLELSLVVPDTGAAWQRWLALGFSGAETGDIWPHAYGVACCEGLSVGLHGAGDEPACITFVRPEVATLERELADRLIGVEREVLGGEDFNLLELREPGGRVLRVQEARTFSPPAELPTHTSLGTFRALSLPCPDLAEARGFWERLDVEVQDIDDPWDGLMLSALPLACHELALCRDPVLMFEADAAQMKAPVAAGRPALLPGLRVRSHRLLRTPDGVALLQLESLR